ncbi:MAG: tetraacyldisaccharide-1-P 4'-kinase [Gammaproteobacteria bacterium]|nr:tetraacyldisaccharide-1-P 4'-kinase [Gammaproteobacteria bacterium]
MFSPEFIEDLWYGRHPASLMLVPLSWLYQIIVLFRRLGYQSGLLPVRRIPVPVIVVGNITVGGNGKTPLVIWLANYLKQKDFHPGIVTRGYGGAAKHWPQQVRPDSDPSMVGDEPILIARRTDCPVAASPNRYEAAAGLLEHGQCNIIICDDGLQHYALARDIEIVVVDGIRRYGNKRCLPAGPLRESMRRLNAVDMVVCNGIPGHGEYQMEYKPQQIRSLLHEDKKSDIGIFNGQMVHAVAGIGHPARFFTLLRKQGMNITEHEFPDHYRFKPGDIRFGDDLPVVMTEKDAVKCAPFAGDEHWYLPINAELGNSFEHRLSMLLKEVAYG